MTRLTRDETRKRANSRFYNPRGVIITETWLYKYSDNDELFKNRGFRQCWKDMQYYAEKYSVGIDVFVYDVDHGDDIIVCDDDSTEEVHKERKKVA